MSRAEKKKNRFKEKSRSRAYAAVYAILKWPIRWLFRIHVKGAENEPKRGKGSYLLVANHLTVLDPVWLCAALKEQQPHFMAKAELFKVPVLASIVRALGAYPVKRGGADVGAIRHTIEILGEGRSVGMFPQGHRRKGVDPRTTDVKTGAVMIALRSGVPLLPAYIKVKDNKPRLFRRIDIIFGEPITVEELGYDPDAAGEYARISALLFERVCALGDEQDP